MEYQWEEFPCLRSLLNSLLHSLNGLYKTQNSASCVAQGHAIDKAFQLIFLVHIFKDYLF